MALLFPHQVPERSPQGEQRAECGDTWRVRRSVEVTMGAGWRL